MENDTLVTGYRITDGWARTNYVYFAISFSKPIVNYGYVDRVRPDYSGFWRRFDIHHNFPEMGGKNVVVYFDFNNAVSQTLVVKVALSAVSTEGAVKNLQQEAGSKSFEQIVAETQGQWERELAAIDVAGTDDQKNMKRKSPKSGIPVPLKCVRLNP